MSKSANRKSLIERINRGREAIAKAKAEGLDTSKWYEHLFNLQLEMLKRGNTKVKVKIGNFGFCTCFLGPALCSGCWKIKEHCKCVIMQVNPEKVINEQYAEYIKKNTRKLRAR